MLRKKKVNLDQSEEGYEIEEEDLCQWFKATRRSDKKTVTISAFYDDEEDETSYEVIDESGEEVTNKSEWEAVVVALWQFWDREDQKRATGVGDLELSQTVILHGGS